MQDGSMSGSEGGAHAPSGRFSGPQEFAQVVRGAIASAAREGWPAMVWSDASFEEWPLGERTVVEALNAWSHSGRQLVMLARSYDSVIRNQPRFVTWRKTWDHLLECHVCKTIDASEMPSAIWSLHWAMRRLDLVRCTGVADLEPARRVLLRQELDECIRQSSLGFPATTLGL